MPLALELPPISENLDFEDCPMTEFFNVYSVVRSLSMHGAFTIEAFG